MADCRQKSPEQGFENHVVRHRSGIKFRQFINSRHVMQLDAIDLKILAQLQQDSSLTNVELARRVHLSPSPCLMRVKALETAGVIAR